MELCISPAACVNSAVGPAVDRTTPYKQRNNSIKKSKEEQLVYKEDSIPNLTRRVLGSGLVPENACSFVLDSFGCSHLSFLYSIHSLRVQLINSKVMFGWLVSVLHGPRTMDFYAFPEKALYGGE